MEKWIQIGGELVHGLKMHKPNMSLLHFFQTDDMHEVAACWVGWETEAVDAEEAGRELESVTIKVRQPLIDLIVDLFSYHGQQVGVADGTSIASNSGRRPISSKSYR
jgi:hypothetical protein